MTEEAKILALHKSPSHTFTKYASQELRLLKGLGVEGDAHMGEKIKHRSRLARDPNQHNLRQVHLIHSELFDEVREKGFYVRPGQMGENITTIGIDLLNLPTGTMLHIGNSAQIEITGLRNPCKQIDSIQDGLMSAVLDKDENGNLVRKAGVMGIVLKSGEIQLNDQIRCTLPEEPYSVLEPV